MSSMYAPGAFNTGTEPAPCAATNDANNPTAIPAMKKIACFIGCTSETIDSRRGATRSRVPCPRTYHLQRRRPLDDGLRDDPKTQHRVGDHQHEHRNLAVYGEARIAKTTERDDVGQRDRRDVTDDDRDQRRIPNESSANDADIGSKARSAKNVPSE